MPVFCFPVEDRNSAQEGPGATAVAEEGETTRTPAPTAERPEWPGLTAGTKARLPMFVQTYFLTFD